MVITMYARIVDNTVIEVIADKPVGYPADMVWVECPDGTGQRDTYDAKTKKFKAYVLPPKRETVLDPETGAKFEGEKVGDPTIPPPKFGRDGDDPVS